MKLLFIVAISFLAHSACFSQKNQQSAAQVLTLRYQQVDETISVFRGDQLLLTQNVKSGTRPYIHPIIAPDGNGVLTEFSPAHHKHQTGLYWGLKKVNGRDYFMNWKGDYWRRVSANVLEGIGHKVKWQHAYELVDEDGNAVLTETQTWSMQDSDGRFVLDLEWRGEAKTNVTMEKFYVGGLFLRMPWREGIGGEVINSERQRNSDAEGKRAKWIDIGLEIDGRKDRAHITILDHSTNADFPNAWRVDNELGIGPSRQILGDWSIQKGKSEIVRYRLIVYTGEFNNAVITRLSNEYTGTK